MSWTMTQAYFQNSFHERLSSLLLPFSYLRENDNAKEHDACIKKSFENVLTLFFNVTVLTAVMDFKIPNQ